MGANGVQTRLMVGTPRWACLKVTNAIQTGQIVRPDRCDDCGTDGPVQAHHKDYSRPLDVEWLCHHCHGDRHRGPERPPRGRRGVQLHIRLTPGEKRLLRERARERGVTVTSLVRSQLETLLR